MISIWRWGIQKRLAKLAHRCECLKGGIGLVKTDKSVNVHTQKTAHTYIRFTKYIHTKFETCFKPNTVVTCKSLEGTSLKRSTHTEVKHHL